MRKPAAIFVAALMLLALPAAAQKPGQTPTQFYNEYRAAWMQSKSMDTLLPFVSKESRAQYETTPKEQRQSMSAPVFFCFIKRAASLIVAVLGAVKIS